MMNLETSTYTLILRTFIDFTNLEDPLFPNILERIRSEYSPKGYFIDVVYPISIIINDPVVWKEDFGK